MPKQLALPAWSEDLLAELGDHRNDARVERRIIALRLFHPQHPVKDVAVLVKVSERSVRQWINEFNRNGLDALRGRPHKGAEAKMTAEQEAEVKRVVAQGPPETCPFSVWRGHSLRQWIHERFGIDYSLSGTYSLLHRLGFSSLVPRPRHPESDPAAQEAFKKNVPRCGPGVPRQPSGATDGGVVPGRGALRPKRHADAHLVVARPARRRPAPDGV